MAEIATIPARRGKAAQLKQGQAIKIINTHGNQVVDTWAFNAGDLREYMGMEHCRAFWERLYPEVGDKMITNRRRPILVLEEDLSPGRHDTLIAPCDNERYGLLGCTDYHDNCRDNLHAGPCRARILRSLHAAVIEHLHEHPVAPGRRHRMGKLPVQERRLRGVPRGDGLHLWRCRPVRRTCCRSTTASPPKRITRSSIEKTRETMNDYYDLGTYHRAVSTRSDEAQRWFNRGSSGAMATITRKPSLCFQKAAAADPDCAMAYWGIAYAAGPNYNKQWKAFDVVDLEQSLSDRAWRDAASPGPNRRTQVRPRRSLIEALRHRYPSIDTQEIVPIWNDNYAAAMREVYRAHSRRSRHRGAVRRSDHELHAVAAVEHQDRQARRGRRHREAIEVLERAMRRKAATNHPGLLHMYVHLMEMSPTPKRHCGRRTGCAN